MAWGGNDFTPLIHLYEVVGHFQSWQANLLLGTYVFGLIPGLLVAAAISDRVGRKAVLVAGLLLGILGSVLLAFGLSSFTVLCIGRALAGIGVGVAMSVGTSAIKELSAPPFQAGAPDGAGARRPTLTLTLGFAIGAAVTGVLAQWGPDPAQLPYFIHIVLSALALWPLLCAPESLASARSGRDDGSGPRPWWKNLSVPSATHVRFTRIVVPAAPWVFGAAGIAYAVMPAVAAPRLGEWTTLYATVLTVLTLGAGALVQPFVTRLNHRTRGRALSIGLTLMAAGMALAVVASAFAQPVAAMVVAVVLGLAYGITVVAGLAHVQEIAPPADLAGLTGVYYSLAYTGFLLPTLLAMLLPVATYAVSLGAVALVCFACLGVVAVASRPSAR